MNFIFATTCELEEAVDFSIKILQQEAKAATSAETTRTYSYATYSHEIVEHGKKRGQARHRWQQTRNAERETAFNSISKLVEDCICKNNEDLLNHLGSTLGVTKDTDYSL